MAHVISETIPLKGNGLCPRSCNLEIARMNSWCHSFRPSDWQPVSSIWWDKLCKIGKRLYPGKKYMLLPWFECPIFPFPGFHHRNSLIQINRGRGGREGNTQDLPAHCHPIETTLELNHFCDEELLKDQLTFSRPIMSGKFLHYWLETWDGPYRECLKWGLEKSNQDQHLGRGYHLRI